MEMIIKRDVPVQDSILVYANDIRRWEKFLAESNRVHTRTGARASPRAHTRAHPGLHACACVRVRTRDRRVRAHLRVPVWFRSFGCDSESGPSLSGRGLRRHTRLSTLQHRTARCNAVHRRHSDRRHTRRRCRRRCRRQCRRRHHGGRRRCMRRAARARACLGAGRAPRSCHATADCCRFCRKFRRCYHRRRRRLRRVMRVWYGLPPCQSGGRRRRHSCGGLGSSTVAAGRSILRARSPCQCPRRRWR
jgi:hypothetical protein